MKGDLLCPFGLRRLVFREEREASTHDHSLQNLGDLSDMSEG